LSCATIRAILAAAIKRSISAVVRYSRVRTEEFTVVGADWPPVRFPTIFCPCFEPTGELSDLSSSVSAETPSRRFPRLRRQDAQCQSNHRQPMGRPQPFRARRGRVSQGRPEKTILGLPSGCTRATCDLREGAQRHCAMGPVKLGRRCRRCRLRRSSAARSEQ
jgi:hypothetical protein